MDGEHKTFNLITDRKSWELKIKIIIRSSSVGFQWFKAINRLSFIEKWNEGYGNHKIEKESALTLKNVWKIALKAKLNTWRY